MSFRNARIKAGKSVAEVMEHMGVTDAAVYQWETGLTMPRTDKLVRLAAFYGCTTDDLLGEEGDGDAG